MSEGISPCSTVVPPHPYGADVKHTRSSIQTTTAIMKRTPLFRSTTFNMPTQESEDVCCIPKHNKSVSTENNNNNTGGYYTSQEHPWWRCNHNSNNSNSNNNYYYWNGSFMQTDTILSSAVPSSTISSLLPHGFRSVCSPQSHLNNNNNNNNRDSYYYYYSHSDPCRTEERMFWPTDSDITKKNGETSPAWYELGCESTQPTSLVQPYNIVETSNPPVREMTEWDLKEKKCTDSKEDSNNSDNKNMDNNNNNENTDSSKETTDSNKETTDSSKETTSVHFSTETKCPTPPTPTSPLEISESIFTSTPASSNKVHEGISIREETATASTVETRDLVQTPPTSSLYEDSRGITLERLMRAVRSARERAKEQRQQHQYQ